MRARHARAALATLATLAAGPGAALAGTYIETPSLAAAVAAGALPPIEARLPENPMVARMAEDEHALGRSGGTLRILMAKSRDTRQLVVYGYARAVCYTPDHRLVADILEDVEVADGRIFTLHLRRGHKWSDGQPFTTEDFRYYWDDVANNEELSPLGPPKRMMADGSLPVFEVIDETTVRYTWPTSNPFFLPAIAGATPLYIYRPAHYLKQFHADYADPAALEALVEDSGRQHWAALHHRLDHQYKNDNPDLPTLQPWVLTTPPPSERFVFKRNPYYYRVDREGRQLPYIDEVVMSLANSNLVALKTSAGETDLQARYLRFDDYTFLKKAEGRNDYNVRLWRTAKGSHFALFPNLNVDDPEWQPLMRDARFRRALSLAINRHEINLVVYFGLALEGNNTVLPQSPLFRTDYKTRWATFDLELANALLDEIGLVERDDRGIRLLPDGRPLELVVETAGESTEQTDVLELIRDTWAAAGIKLFTKPSHREVFRNRIFAGETLMSVWTGIENGIASAMAPPTELAPTTQGQLQWPQWGQYYETSGQAGEPPALAEAKRLLALNEAWRRAVTEEDRVRIWREMLEIHADQVFTIGVVSGTLQPVVVSNRLHNVPEEAVYNWNPGAHFGIYKPDTFWFEPDSVEAAKIEE